MIVGQNSLLNQYVPTFLIKNLYDGQTLVYDSTRKAFVNATPTGGGGATPSLGELLNVSPTVDTTAVSGQALVYNPTTALWGNQFIDYNTLLNKPTSSNFSFAGLSDTSKPPLPNGYVQWNSTGTQLIYSTTIPASSISGLSNGSVTTVSVVTANGISGTVANPTTTPAITLSLVPTGVTAGVYTNADITVGADGRITSASSGSPSGTGTVTSVSGTGTVSGLSLSGNVTTSGSLTLSGNLILTSGQVTTALGYTPYSNTNPAGYTTNTGTVTSVGITSTASRITVSNSPITTNGNIALDLATTAVTPGSYTLADITVDAYGRITSATNGTAGGTGTVTSITAGNGLTGGTITTTGTIALPTTGVTAGSYTAANITVDAYGRLTSAASGAAGTGTSETVIFQYDTGSGGAMTGSGGSNIISQTSGVTATITSGAACICTFAFTGKSAPPKTVTSYGQVTSSNLFVTKDISGYSSNTTVGGGTVAAPAILTGFTSANIITLTLTQGTTGAVGGIGLRAFLMVTFGF